MSYFWIHEDTAVTTDPVHGKCRFPTAHIKKDEIVFVVGGYARKPSESGWYKGLMIDKDLIIDLPEGSEFEAYVNHSCDPNLYIDGQVTFRALRDILPGEFLNVDYGTFMLTKADPIPVCNCGAKKCRGTVKGTDYKFLQLPLSWYAQKEKNKHD